MESMSTPMNWPATSAEIETEADAPPQRMTARNKMIARQRWGVRFMIDHSLNEA
jgi:hypothetical protein